MKLQTSRQASCASKFSSQIPFLHLCFFCPPSSSLLAGGTEGGTGEGDSGRAAELPDLSYRKVSHQKDVLSTALASSFDEFEEMKEGSSALTITQQERKGKGKENKRKESKLNTAHTISKVKLFALFRSVVGFQGHQSLHLCTLWDHNHHHRAALLGAQCHCFINCSWSPALLFPHLNSPVHWCRSCSC